MADQKEHVGGKEGQWQADQSASARVTLTAGAGADDGVRNLSTLVLMPGMRVELTSSPTAVTLRSRTGRIARQDDQDDDYVIVALDNPAQYHHANGEVEDLPEIVVMADNLRALGS